MANVVRFKIGGIEYSLTADEDAAYIKGLASELEQKLISIKTKSPFLSETMAAVVAALESLDEAKKQAAESEKLRLEIKKLLEETACAKLDAELYRRRLSEYEVLEEDRAAVADEIDIEVPEAEEDLPESENLQTSFDDLPF